jgi:hypothetical protein
MYAKAQENGNSENSKESYHNPNMVYYQRNDMIVQQPEPMSTPMMVLVFILYLALGIYAAKLSWYSNTKAGWSQGYKVLFAILAFMFPITYITAHVLFKLDLLSKIRGGSMSY